MYRKFILLTLCFIFMFTLTSCSKTSTIDSDKSYTKYVDIYDVVKEAFLTDNGYTNELSKHISPEVFKHTNYKLYQVDASKHQKINFSLNEVYQTKENDLVYVDMIYSIDIIDANGKNVAGSRNIPITFTVKTTGNDWYILGKYEPL
jgi:hypothetical protein